MSEPTHFEKVVSYVMSNDESELTNMTAERDYALHCLEREIAIAHQAQARIEALEAALRVFADPLSWRRDGSCDPNSGRFEGQSIARAALAEGQDK